ncbi:MAG TPA: hypothetical protein VN914_00990 [Polyangia bacterium]|nr:hypothetical protein [Polyangia bacterium]
MALCSLSPPARAQADADDGEVAWSVGAGCAVVMASMAVGGGISAAVEGNRARRTGIGIVSAGLALGPVVSHGIAGEWKRAAVFGGTAAAIGIFNTILVERSTAVLDHGPPSSRIPFGIALATEVLVSTAGLVDSMMAGDRRQRRVAVLPLVDGRSVGLALGGTL